MIIYKDLISGDELFSDIYKMKILGGAGGVLYELEGKLTTETTDISDEMIGGNASAEEPAEASADSSSKSGCNIVLANRLVETGFSKKDYKLTLKQYMKKLCECLEKDNPDRVASFKKGAVAALKMITEETDFKDWQFFRGESMNEDGMIALMNFREDGVTPYMLFWKDGLLEEKV